MPEQATQTEQHVPSAAIRFLALPALYFAGAWVGQLLSPPGLPFATFWLPAGIAVATLARLPLGRWPEQVAAFALADLLHALSAGFPLADALVFGPLSMLEAVTSAWLLQRLLSRRPALGSPRDLLALLLAAAVGPLVSSPLVAIALHWLEGSPLGLWRFWYVGDLLGMLLVVPPVLVLRRTPPRPRSRARLAEAAALLATLALVARLVFFVVGPTGLSLQFLLAPVLLWCALRFGVLGVAAAGGLLSLLAARSVQVGLGEFAALGLEPAARCSYFQAVLGFSLLTYYALAVTVDERQRAFQAFVAERRAAEQAQRMASVGMVAAGVAHEINGPLAVVLSSLDFLADTSTASSEELRAAALADAGDGARRVRDIVQDMRSFSRADDGEPTRLDLHDPLRAAVRLARAEIRKRGRLVEELGPTPTVRASEGRLAQVFLNLLVNAAHALTPNAGSTPAIRLRTFSGPDGWAVVEVADEGEGIPPEVLPQIFEPFFTTKPLGQGTGLGLYVVRGFVAAAGGRIEVESTPGRGSTFRVLLPPAA